MKAVLAIATAFSCFALIAQEKPQKSNYLEEDLKYEIEHKSQPWYQDMKPGASYFEVKELYDAYFGEHTWEKSKPRATGEAWLKSQLFYLDANGIVQEEPYYALEPNQKSLPSTKNLEKSTTTVGTWDLLGPVNSAETAYSGAGNHGGYVYLNRIDPTNAQKMFVAFLTGGLWMTDDGGTDWTLVDNGFPDDMYNDIDVCIANPNTVYALAEQNLLKSTDGGNTFSATTMNKANYSGTSYDLAASPNDANVVLVRWGTNLYRSSDGGTTWSAVLSGLTNYQIWDCSIHSEMLDWSTTNNNEVYIINHINATQIEIHKSTDAGLTFSLLQTITLDAAATGTTIGWAKLMLPSNNNASIYVAMGSGSTAYGHQAAHLYKLNDNTGAIELERINMLDGITNGENLHHGDIVMDRNNEDNIIWGTYSEKNVHISTNNGASFSISAENTHSDLRTLDLVSGNALVGSDGEAVFSTDLGNTNVTLTNSISNHELWGFGSAFKTNLVASGNNHGPVMIKETANGFDWYNGIGADQGNTDVNPLDDRYLYSQGYSNYRFFRTGVHTLENQANFLDVGGIYSYFNSIEFHPNQYYTIITHHAGQYPIGNPNLATWKNSLVKTEDNGNSISIVHTFNDEVFREKISMKNPDVMYVVVGLTNNELWKTIDGGVTWTEITPTLAQSSNQTNISDIAVSDENPDEIWITYGGVQSTCKVLQSTDGGVSYANLTQSILTDFPITKIIFQRGSDGAIYVGGKAGVFYKNNATANWTMLGNGLPMSDVRFMFINYNESKLKIGTSRGAFIHDLAENITTNALISADKKVVTCPVVETVKFKDYSVVQNSSATWSWTFEGGNPATSTDENPEVSYSSAANGLYDVTLTVTDAFGTSTQTLTDFIEVDNSCGSSNPDTIPGNMAFMGGETDGDFLEIDNLNLNKNSFTFSCWIKPDGTQDDYSALFATQDANNMLALNFNGGNNSVGYHPAWPWNSGLIAPADEWSHVAMTSNGTEVKIYVNGIESVDIEALPNEIFNKVYLGKYGRGYTNRVTQLEMDEVSFWNRPLTIEEIRASRHLTKSNTNHPILNGLVAYYQFNETVGNFSINKAGGTNSALYFGANVGTHNPSNAPVFGGVSEKITVNATGLYDAQEVGSKFYFGNGSYPDGDLWISRSTINPDVLPNADNQFNSYFVVNNYGVNENFTALDSISFYNNPNYLLTGANRYQIYTRPENGFGNTWGSSFDDADQTVGATEADLEVVFSDGFTLEQDGQLIITNSSSASLDNLDNEQSIAIFPNPIEVGEPLTILLNENQVGGSFNVFDVTGKKVANSTLAKTDNKLVVHISAGVYTFVYNVNSQKYSGKIIIK